MEEVVGCKVTAGTTNYMELIKEFIKVLDEDYCYKERKVS